MSEEKSETQWWVTWGLELVSFPKGTEPDVFAAPHVGVFKIPFTTKHEASVFAAEVQRFLGDLYLQSTVISPDRLNRMIEQVLRRAGVAHR